MVLLLFPKAAGQATGHLDVSRFEEPSAHVPSASCGLTQVTCPGNRPALRGMGLTYLGRLHGTHVTTILKPPAADPAPPSVKPSLKPLRPFCSAGPHPEKPKTRATSHVRAPAAFGCRNLVKLNFRWRRPSALVSASKQKPDILPV